MIVVGDVLLLAAPAAASPHASTAGAATITAPDRSGKTREVSRADKIDEREADSRTPHHLYGNCAQVARRGPAHGR